MSSTPVKRSRFDQVEPNVRRSSRFDRRSRSRSPVKGDVRPERSPVADLDRGSGARLDPASAAAAAAAKINASLTSRSSSVPEARPPPPSEPDSDSAAFIPKDVYTQDGDFIKDVEINDLKNRYTLTRGPTQKMIKDQTGADVTTRGEYYPDKSMATPTKPPLYLHVTSTSKEGLDQAMTLIEELIRIELPPLIDERRVRRTEEQQRQPPPAQPNVPQAPDEEERPGPEDSRRGGDFDGGRPQFQGDREDRYRRRGGLEDRVPIDLEPIPGFNLRAQVVGHGGAYVKHIQSETRCRVQIKGRGSGFVDRMTGQETDEPMFLHIVGYDADAIAHAKELCVDLVDNVRRNYESFKERNAQNGFQNRRRFDREDGRDSRDRDHREFRDRDSYHRRDDHRDGRDGRPGQDRYNNYQPGRPDSPEQHAGPSLGSPTARLDPRAGYDAAAAYGAQQYGAAQEGYAGAEQDPYAAYGGYQNYVAMYYHYYGQQMAHENPAGEAGNPPADQPPPPPPGTDLPPPPPPEQD